MSLKEKLAEDLKSSMKTKTLYAKIQYNLSVLQYCRLKRTTK